MPKVFLQELVKAAAPDLEIPQLDDWIIDLNWTRCDKDDYFITVTNDAKLPAIRDAVQQHQIKLQAEASSSSPVRIVSYAAYEASSRAATVKKRARLEQ